MRINLIAYISTAIVFFGMDFVWISLTATPLYKARLGGLMLDKPNLAVAGGFYLMYVVGVIVFAVLPALSAGRLAPCPLGRRIARLHRLWCI